MKTITLDAKDFLAGESQWDYIQSNGFSPDSRGLNLFLKPGVLNFGWTATDRGGATLTGNIVANAYDKNNAGNDAYSVDDEGAFYTLFGSTFTKRQTVTADTFQLGTTDMIQFKLVTYASGQTRVVALTGSDLATVDSSWWTGLTSGYRHPLEVVEDTMYIGDLNIVYFFDGTTSGIAVTLPSDCNITSLRKHPDGRHLIAFTGYQQNAAHTNGGPGKIYIINKDTKVWEREIQVDTQVEGSRLLGGIVYITYGKKLGYFTGAGIQFLKQLKTSKTTYSHSMANMEDILLVRDGVNALAFGDLGNGRKTWHSFHVVNGSQHINTLFYKGQNSSGNPIVLAAYSDGAGAGVMLELDYSTATVSGTLQFVSRRYNFGSTVNVRRMDIIHDQKGSGSALIFNLYPRDTNDALSAITKTYTADTSNPFKTRFDLDIQTDIFQFELLPSTGILGIKLIRFYYEPIN